MSEFTHFDDEGRPAMVDVGGKKPTERRAVAEGWVLLPDGILEALIKKKLSKGNPFSVAELGGIMGAKRASELIPLCHAIKLNKVAVRCDFVEHKRAVRIECMAVANDVTGVEMEALTGVSIAALVFYDMCKGVDKGMRIEGIRLLEKMGGKSGSWFADEAERSYEEQA